MDLKGPVYVVKAGRSKGLFKTKDEAIKVTRGFPNAVYERVDTANALFRYCEDSPDLHLPMLEYCKANDIPVRVEKSKGLVKFSVYQQTPVLSSSSASKNSSTKIGSSLSKPSSSLGTTSQTSVPVPSLSKDKGKTKDLDHFREGNNSVSSQDSFGDSSQSSFTEEDENIPEGNFSSPKGTDTQVPLQVYIASSAGLSSSGRPIMGISVTSYNKYGAVSQPHMFMAERLPADQPQTKEVADLWSLIKALEMLPQERNVSIHTSSSYLVSVVKQLYTYKMQGWLITVPHIVLIRYLSYLWDVRRGATEIRRSPSLSESLEARSTLKSATDSLHTYPTERLTFKFEVPENY